MALPIIWTPLADLTVLEMRGRFAPWPMIARHLQVGRSAVIERARSLGIPPKTRLPPAKPVLRAPRIDRPPLPPGHPVTWGAITDGTPYPYPVFL
jgi:hypothetical protein